MERAPAAVDIDAISDVGVVEPAGQSLDRAQPFDLHSLAASAGRRRRTQLRQPGRGVRAAARSQHVELADRHRRVAADDLVGAVEHRPEGRGLDLRFRGAERARAAADPEALLHAQPLRARAGAKAQRAGKRGDQEGRFSTEADHRSPHHGPDRKSRAPARCRWSPAPRSRDRRRSSSRSRRPRHSAAARSPPSHRSGR